MKKLYLVVLVLSMLFVGVTNVDAYVNVKGYYRSNGTYVAPHVRSNPNGLKYDNYSYTPSQGLYNATYGTRGSYWDTPTYITDPDYYIGQSLYNSNSSGSSSSYPSTNYYTPSYSSSYTNSTYTPSSSSYTENITGGYKIGSTVICNSGYYKLNNKCQIAPPNSVSYGGSDFYCNSGYEKSGSSCFKTTYNYGSYSSPSTSSSMNTSTSNVDPYHCPDGYSWYLDKCVKKLENARYDGSSYSCDKGYYVNMAGNQCVSIDTWCKEKLGITSRGENGNCYCNAGYSFDTATNRCKSNY